MFDEKKLKQAYRYLRSTRVVPGECAQAYRELHQVLVSLRCDNPILLIEVIPAWLRRRLVQFGDVVLDTSRFRAGDDDFLYFYVHFAFPAHEYFSRYKDRKDAKLDLIKNVTDTTDRVLLGRMVLQVYL